MKRWKSAVFMGLLFAMIVSGVSVYASSYTTTLAFQGEHEGAVRTFDGQNIRYSANTYSGNP